MPCQYCDCDLYILTMTSTIALVDKKIKILILDKPTSAQDNIE